MSNDRTYGQTQDCRGCRFWSEMVAMVDHRVLRALCLAKEPAPMSLQYTHGLQKCDAWASGHLGAIDDPGDDPERYEWPEMNAMDAGIQDDDIPY